MTGKTMDCLWKFRQYGRILSMASIISFFLLFGYREKFLFLGIFLCGTSILFDEFLQIMFMDSALNHLKSKFFQTRIQIPFRFKKLFFNQIPHEGKHILTIIFYLLICINCLLYFCLIIVYIVNLMCSGNLISEHAFEQLVITNIIFHVSHRVPLQILRLICTLKKDSEKYSKPHSNTITLPLNVKKWSRERIKVLELKNKLKKYCYIRKKGVSYLQYKDLERIKTIELIKYKEFDTKIELNEKGKQTFKVFDKRNGDVIFQAPLITRGTSNR